MPKFLKILSTAAFTLLGMSACDSLEVLSDSNDMQDVTVTTVMPASIQSRAGESTVGKGANVDQLQYAVYDESTIVEEGTATISNGEVSLKFRLSKGKQYEFIFFACNEAMGGSIYNFDKANKTLSINYNGLSANDDLRDAFYAAEKVTINAATQQINLKRPFAQLNVGTDDFDEAKISYDDNLSLSISISNLPNVLNLSTSEVSGSVAASFTSSVTLNNEPFPGSDKTNYLSLNYILPHKDGFTRDLTYSIKKDNVELASATINDVPFKRNYRTNISGYLLTDETGFNIVISPSFEDETLNPGEDNTEEYSRPESYSNGSETVFKLASANDLRWIQEQAATDETFWDNNTIELSNNIDLSVKSRASDSKTVWTPINVNPLNRKVVIDGKGYTISNFTFADDGKSNKGLFGEVSNAVIRNLNVEGVSFNASSSDNVGAVVGFISGQLENISVSRVEINVANGINIGGLAGVVSGLTESEQDRMLQTTKIIDSKIYGQKAVGGMAGKFDNVSVGRLGGSIYFVLDDQEIKGNTITASLSNAGLFAGEASNKNETVFYSNLVKSNNSTEALLGEGKIDVVADIIGGTYEQNGNTFTVRNFTQLQSAIVEINSIAKANEEYVLEIKNDMNLRGNEIAPLHISTSVALLTVHGNNHTISNCIIKGSESSVNVGLFEKGNISADRLNLRDIQVVGVKGASCGILLGTSSYNNIFPERSFTDIRVTNSSVKDGPYCGVVIGTFQVQNQSTNLTISNVTVENCEIVATDNAGGFLGRISNSAQAKDFSAEISNLSVLNSTMTANAAGCVSGSSHLSTKYSGTGTVNTDGSQPTVLFPE